MKTTTLLLIAAMWFARKSTAAPTRMNNALSLLQDQLSTFVDQLCSSTACLYGDARFDLYSLTCACPDPPVRFRPLTCLAGTDQAKFTDPCGGLSCDGDQEPFYSILSNSCYCGTMEDWHKKEDETYNAVVAVEQQPVYDLQRRQAPPPNPVPTFIPPPKQDITPELIQESLTVQPQNKAVVGSIIPYFHDGVVRVYLQLDGPVAYTLVVNASTSLPCGAIGLVDPQPNLALVPLVINQGQGQPQVVVADCEVIAVNMYQPGVITWWIQKVTDGTIYSVLGKSLVKDLDKMNTTQSTALALTALAPGASKRDEAADNNIQYVRPEKRQIWRVNCNYACPFYHMRMVKSTDGTCACLFSGADEKFVDTKGWRKYKEFIARDLIQPDMMNAKMTADACAAMTCFNNGGTPAPALFNPFHQTCWCITQPYIESNPDAWTSSP